MGTDLPPSTPVRAVVPDAENLGRALRLLRIHRGLNQGEVAKALGVTRQYVIRMESTKPDTHTERLFALLELLGVRLDLVAPPMPEKDVEPTDPPEGPT